MTDEEAGFVWEAARIAERHGKDDLAAGLDAWVGAWREEAGGPLEE